MTDRQIIEGIIKNQQLIIRNQNLMMNILTRVEPLGEIIDVEEITDANE